MKGVVSQAPAAPLTPREARLLDYFHRVQDDFFPIGKWPAYLLRMMLLEHKNNRERFTLFFFLTGNGLAPTIATGWILTLDIEWPDKRIQGNYDPSAIKQMQQLIEQERSGTLFKGDKKIMDMTLGYVVNK